MMREMSVSASQLSGLSTDDQADVDSQLPTATTDVSTAMASGDVGQLAGAADELIALNDLTGGKLNLSDLISQVENSLCRMRSMLYCRSKNWSAPDIRTLKRWPDKRHRLSAVV
jgi:hypothetical protein